MQDTQIALLREQLPHQVQDEFGGVPYGMFGVVCILNGVGDEPWHGGVVLVLLECLQLHECLQGVGGGAHTLGGGHPGGTGAVGLCTQGGTGGYLSQQEGGQAAGDQAEPGRRSIEVKYTVSFIQNTHYIHPIAHPWVLCQRLNTKRDVILLLAHWTYVSFALSYWYASPWLSTVPVRQLWPSAKPQWSQEPCRSLILCQGKQSRDKIIECSHDDLDISSVVELTKHQLNHLGPQQEQLSLILTSERNKQKSHLLILSSTLSFTFNKCAIAGFCYWLSGHQKTYCLVLLNWNWHPCFTVMLIKQSRSKDVPSKNKDW